MLERGVIGEDVRERSVGKSLRGGVGEDEMDGVKKNRPKKCEVENK